MRGKGADDHVAARSIRVGDRHVRQYSVAGVGHLNRPGDIGRSNHGRRVDGLGDREARGDHIDDRFGADRRQGRAEGICRGGRRHVGGVLVDCCRARVLEERPDRERSDALDARRCNDVCDRDVGEGDVTGVGDADRVGDGRTRDHDRLVDRLRNRHRPLAELVDDRAERGREVCEVRHRQDVGGRQVERRRVGDDVGAADRAEASQACGVAEGGADADGQDVAALRLDGVGLHDRRGQSRRAGDVGRKRRNGAGGGRVTVGDEHDERRNAGCAVQVLDLLERVLPVGPRPRLRR